MSRFRRGSSRRRGAKPREASALVDYDQPAVYALPLLPLVPRDAASVAPRSVRLSLTDRCDLACVYCRPSRNDGYLEKRLEDEAWRAMVRALAALPLKLPASLSEHPLFQPTSAGVSIPAESPMSADVS